MSADFWLLALVIVGGPIVWIALVAVLPTPDKWSPRCRRAKDGRW
jgi:hypothetical protein